MIESIIRYCFRNPRKREDEEFQLSTVVSILLDLHLFGNWEQTLIKHLDPQVFKRYSDDPSWRLKKLNLPKWLKEEAYTVTV